MRALEGVTDVIVFAALFDLVRRSSRGHVGAGMGIASTPLLMGLGFGAMFGGLVVRQSAGGASANWLFGLSAVLSIFVAGIAFIARQRFEAFEPSADIDISNSGTNTKSNAQVRDPMWPSLAMTFSDRATGGLITGTLPIALSQVFGYSPLVRGLLVGLPLLLMALGTGPAGWLCDRIGSLRVRIFAGVAYAASFALLSVAGDQAIPLGIVMVIIGISARALFQFDLSSFDLVLRRWRSVHSEERGSWFPQRNCLLCVLVVFAWWRVADIFQLCSSSHYFCCVSRAHNIDHGSRLEIIPQPQCDSEQFLGHKLGSIWRADDSWK